MDDSKKLICYCFGYSEADIVDDAKMPLERQRVLADEEMLMAGEADHHVAGGNPAQPFVGRNPHDRRIEMSARARIPTRVEGRVQRQAVMGNGNAGYLHENPR